MKFSVNELAIKCTQPDLITSGSVGLKAEFVFSDDWLLCGRTVVFTAGTVTKTQFLGDNNICDVPWETLQVSGKKLIVGVYGMSGSTITKPTIYTNAGTIEVGTSIVDIPGTTFTPDLTEELIATAQNALNVANATQPYMEAAQVAASEAEVSKNAALIAQGMSESAQDAAELARVGAELAEDGSITAKDESVAARDITVAAKDVTVTAKGESIAARDITVAAKDITVAAKDAAVIAAGEAQSYAKFGTFYLEGNMLVAMVDAATNITDIKIDETGELVITID